MSERSYLKRKQRNFRGGLFTAEGPTGVPPNCYYKGQNMVPDVQGFRTIPGDTKLNGTKIDDKAVTSMYRAYWGTKSVSLASAGTSLYWLNGTTWTALAGTFTENKPWSFVSISGVVYCTNGTDTEQKIDFTVTPAEPPTIATMTGPATKCKFFTYVKNKIWAYGNDTFPERAWPCGITELGVVSPESWDANEYMPFPKAGSYERIVSGGVWNDQLVILTDNSVCMLLGNDLLEYEVDILETNVSCVAPYATCNRGRDIIFFTRKGFRLFTGQSSRLISEDIQPQIDDINPTYFSNMVAIADEDRYYASYVSTEATGTTNNRMLIFDTTLSRDIAGVIKGGWTGPHTIGAASFMRYFGKADTGQLYYGDATATGFVRQFYIDATHSLLGTDIAMVVETGDISFEELGVEMETLKFFEEQITEIVPEGAYNLTVKYYLDNISTAVAFPSSPISLASSGPNFGDRDNTTTTRNIIVMPLVFGETVSGWFVRIRYEFTGQAKCKVNSIKTIASALVKEGR